VKFGQQVNQVQVNHSHPELIMGDRVKCLLEVHKAHGRKAKKPKPPPNLDSSSYSAEHRVQTERQKHPIKPPKYDRTSLFKTVLVQFHNCSAYNR